ncbi:MAG: hypothetical protein R3B89_33630 [Polyangiaceae bacterium]
MSGPASLHTQGARRLGLLLASAQAGETALDALMLARFVEQIGATALPLALAMRAGVDAVGSVLAERLLGRFPAARRIAAMMALGGALCVLSLVVREAWAIYVGFVGCSLVTRQRSIDFGVLTLERLPRGRREHHLPGVYALGRVGALLSGGVLLIAGAHAVVALLAAFGFLAATVAAGGAAGADSPDPAAPASVTESQGSHGMLTALMLGALALAAGRVALITQSGGILERAFDEHTLVRVLGGYSVVTALVSLLLQISFLRRWLSGGQLEWVNGIWGLGYLLGQLGLALTSGVSPGLAVPLALGARWVDGELRAALRGPVTNLLYEVMPARDRRRARTWVIGVTVPLGGLVAGLALNQVGSSPVLAWTGGVAGLCVGISTLIQGRLWARSRVGLSIGRDQS